MLRNPTEMLQLGSDEQEVKNSALAPPEKDGYWVYTPDGYVFLSNTRPAPHEIDNSLGLMPAFVETCF